MQASLGELRHCLLQIGFIYVPYLPRRAVIRFPVNSFPKASYYIGPYLGATQIESILRLSDLSCIWSIDPSRFKILRSSRYAINPADYQVFFFIFACGIFAHPSWKICSRLRPLDFHFLISKRRVDATQDKYLGWSNHRICQGPRELAVSPNSRTGNDTQGPS